MKNLKIKSIFNFHIPLHSSRSIFLEIGSNIRKNDLFHWLLWIFKNDYNLVQFGYSYTKVGTFISYVCNIQLSIGRFKPVWIHYGNNRSATMLETPYFVSLRFAHRLMLPRPHVNSVRMLITTQNQFVHWYCLVRTKQKYR